MTFTHALSTNNYGPCKFIVATSAANGTHTTLASAMAAASVGDTIFLRDTVTENVTITPGVNIAAWSGQGANTPAIIGTLTMTAAGTSTISGIRLQTNGAFAIAVTGSAASILNIADCYLNFTNNTGISFTSSSSSAFINIYNTAGNLGTTGIAIYSVSSAGTLGFTNSTITNTGASSTASSNSAGLVGFTYCALFSPLSCSSAANLILNGGFVNTISLNTACITSSGTSQVSLHGDVSLASGSASSLSIGTGTQVAAFGLLEVNSTNTNAITGAGTIQYGLIIYAGSSSTNNVSTQSAYARQPAAGTFVKQIRAITSTAGSTTTALPYDNTIPQITEGAEILTATITPSSASNILVIECTMWYSTTAGTGGGIALFQDSTANALAANTTSVGLNTAAIALRYYMTAGTTSATTFRIRGGYATGATFFWLQSAASSNIFSTASQVILTVTEYTP